MAVSARQCSKSWLVETRGHCHTEHQPTPKQGKWPPGSGQQSETESEEHIGRGQDSAAASLVDQVPDASREEGRNSKAKRERAKDPSRRQPKIRTHDLS
jgi:hypothetical protein